MNPIKMFAIRALSWVKDVTCADDEGNYIVLRCGKVIDTNLR